MSEWISVKERLPEHGAIVLCNTDYFIEVLQWDERSCVWVGDCRIYTQKRVTHWMPLPKPPVAIAENAMITATNSETEKVHEEG